MAQLFTQIFTFLFAIFLLVTAHEYCHFWVARRLGIKALRFSIGFGKPLWRWYGKDGVEYVIAMLPLGGYVKLLDERDGEVPENEKHLAFNRQPLWSRTLVVLAGPVSNWLLAIVLFWIIFLIGVEPLKSVVGNVTPNSIAAQAGLKPDDQLLQIDNHATPTWQKALIAVVYRMGETGQMQIIAQPAKKSAPETHTLNLSTWKVDSLNPDPLKSLGIEPYQPPMPPVISEVIKGQAAQNAGLQAQDRVLAVDSKPITEWIDFIKFIQQHPDQKVNVTVQRGSQKKTFTVNIGHKLAPNWKTIGFIGIVAQPPEWPKGMKVERKYSVLNAWIPAVAETVSFTKFNFVIFGKMLRGQVSFKGLGGPITIFTSAKNAWKQGLLVYVGFLAILSVMLACLNILPIPGLDGGHLFYYLIEAIRGRPVSMAAQLLAWRIGIVALVLIMIQATFNDLMRLFQ